MERLFCSAIAEISSHDSASGSIFTRSLEGRPFLQTIPPERVGLHGEYDYNGLTKRVSSALHQQFRANQLGNLRVEQRGAVVLLSGDLPREVSFDEVVRVVLQVEGAVGVECDGKTVV